MVLPEAFPRKGLIIFFSLLYCIGLLIAHNSITQLIIERLQTKQREQVTLELALVRSKLEAAVFMDTYLADSLATVVTLDPDFALANWDAIAGKLLQKSQNVRNVGVAPNNIISHMYPVKGNEKAIGLDFRTRPEQLKTVLLAKELEQVYIAGPLELVQGGIALIARYPIFSDYPQNNRYWGSISVVINYEQLLLSSGLNELKGAHIALAKTSPSQTSPQLIYGAERTLQQADLIQPINLPSGQWQLAAIIKPDLAQIERTQLIINLVASIGGLLCYLFILLLYRNYQYVHRNALHDDLTQLPNRRNIMNRVKRLSVNAHKAKTTFSVLNIDVNGFKQVNDQFGHETGDRLLQFIATQLQACVRSSDSVARMGGDEFIVVLEGLNQEQQLQRLIDKIHQHFYTHHCYVNEQHIRASLSIGYAIYQGKDMTIKALLAKADRAMYHNKQQLKQQQAAGKA